MLISAILTLAGLAASSAAADGQVEVVQSVPVETNLAVPGIRSAQDVWVEMINSAQSTLDLEQFYISNQAGEALDPVLQAISAAANRGVHVRLIVDKKFYGTYPDSVNQIAQTSNSEARTIDFSDLGGIQHAKYFIVDGREAFVGSQNFDWRALDQIHEIGLRVTDSKVDSDLQLIFEKDWAASSGVSASVSSPSSPLLAIIGEVLSDGPADSGSAADVFVAASPASANPAGIPDSLSTLTGLIAQAQRSLRIQVMEYTTSVYGTSQHWTDLDHAVRAAAARGVHVQLMVDVSDLKSGSKDLSALAKLPNIEVTSITIPQWSGGKIAYARLIHSKYMIVDETTAWVGSENWSQGYFMNTRDVGLVIQTPAQVSQLNQVFDQVWSSGYGSRI
jgi:phosphatidylserine/phosphatidylglycerophosphate/cardiolipin synthase-like enzyme